MRRLFSVCIILLMVFAASGALGAGTVTPSLYLTSADANVMVFKLTCVGDAADGSVPDTQITASLLNWAGHNFPVQYWMMGYYLYEVWVEIPAGGTAPDLADVTITDATGAILFDQNSVVPVSGTYEGTVDKARGVTSLITASVQNQATTSATYNIYLKLVK